MKRWAVSGGVLYGPNSRMVQPAEYVSPGHPCDQRVIELSGVRTRMDRLSLDQLSEQADC